MSVQYLANLGRYSLDLGITQSYIRNDGVNKSSLGQFNDAILKFLDAHSNIISSVALTFNGQLEVT